LRNAIIAFAACLGLLVGGVAHAQQPVVENGNASWNPFALNLWAGLGYDYLHFSGQTALDTSNGKLGVNLGGDLGFRFSPEVGLVAFAEYAPIISSDVASHVVTVGGGLRFQPAIAQFLVGAGYSNLSGGGSTTGGFGVKLMAFYPVASGFGPYLQLNYNRFSPGGGSLDLFSANAGLSFSY
jgi:hypothetical protein